MPVFIFLEEFPNQRLLTPINAESHRIVLRLTQLVNKGWITKTTEPISLDSRRLPLSKQNMETNDVIKPSRSKISVLIELRTGPFYTESNSVSTYIE